MVISLVRTGSRLGFAKDPRRVNVALTRARTGLVIIGNIPAIRDDPMYARLLAEFRARQLLYHGNLDDPQAYSFSARGDVREAQLHQRLLELLERLKTAHRALNRLLRRVSSASILSTRRSAAQHATHNSSGVRRHR
eukprot:2567499-Prymnesium_polylepis.1